MIEQDLYDVLKTLADGRVYPSVALQGEAYPQIVYQRISTGRYNSLDGDQLVGTPRFQVTCWGATAKEAIDTAAAVKAAVRASALTAHTDSEQDDYDSDLKVHARRVDFLITGID